MFDPPLAATSKVNGHELLVLLYTAGGVLLVVDEFGDMAELNASDLNMNWRFKDGKWIDVGLEEPDGS